MSNEFQIFLGKVRPLTSPGRGPSTGSDHCSGKDGGWASGPTYDLESWHGTFNEQQQYSTHCGNLLGTAPDGPLGGPYDPSLGQSDIRLPANLA